MMIHIHERRSIRHRKRRRPSTTAWVLVKVAVVVVLLLEYVPTADAFTAAGTKKVVSKGIKESSSIEERGFGLTVCCDSAERKQKHVKWDERKHNNGLPSSSGSSSNCDSNCCKAENLPPWLSRYYKHSSQQGGGLQQKLQWLEYTLVEQEQWSWADVQQVIQAMRTFADSSSDDDASSEAAMMLGMTDFLTTLVETTTTASTTVEKEGVKLKEVVAEQVSKSRAEQATSEKESSPFVTKEILLASIWHYAESIAARKQGLLSNEFVHKNVLGGNVEQRRSLPSDVPRLPPSRPVESSLWSKQDEEQPIQVVSALSSKMMISIPHSVEAVTQFQPYNVLESLMVLPLQMKPQQASVLEENKLDSEMQYVENLAVWKITRGASQIKRAEILARVVGTRNNSSSTAILSLEEASRIRGLLLTVDDFDWRSLMLRCVACLYRLEGILEGDNTFQRTPEVVLTAREGLRVYATLAQQLGLGRLKARIEDRAFQILYQRQYRAVTALYTNTRPTTKQGEPTRASDQDLLLMDSVSSFLQARITATLFEDEALMAQLENLQVTARVKERFSFWKKLLKKRFKEVGYLRAAKTALDAASSVESSQKGVGPARPTAEEAAHASLTLSSNNLSISDVPDTVALRVILRARKWYENEPEETTRARERLLCYYVQQKLRSNWPAIEPKRVKDYIQFPKPNGYQSLHYTSAVIDSGVEFPFEVQIRSEEMHQIAEHGVASHWGYKLGNQSAPAESTLFLGGSSSLDDCNRTPTALTAQTNVQRATTRSTSNSYLDSLALVRQNMVDQQVYVFVTATGNHIAGSSSSSLDEHCSAEEIGKLVSVPANARVDEAVRAMLKEYSANGFVPNGTLQDAVAVEPKVWRNGRIARINDMVENGDVLLVAL